MIKNVHDLSVSLRSLFVADDGYLSMKMIYDLLPTLNCVVMTELSMHDMRECMSEYLECIQESNNLRRFDFQSVRDMDGKPDDDVRGMVYESMASFSQMGRTLVYVFNDDDTHQIVSERKDEHAVECFEAKKKAAVTIQSFLRCGFERVKYLKYLLENMEILKFREEQMLYEFDGPLTIKESFAVHPAKQLEIRCAANILIEAEILITAWCEPLRAEDVAVLNQKGEINEYGVMGLDVGLRKKQKKRFAVEVCRDGDTSELEDKDFVLSGKVNVRSSGKVINYGTVGIGSSRKLRHRGEVVVIEAAGFINEGIINPEPTIFISSGGTSELSEFGERERDEKEQLVSMEYYDHRGHYMNEDNRHPTNLLTDEYKSYLSIHGVTTGDWLMFKLNRNQFPIKPTSINIKNYDGKSAIKDIRIWIGCDDGKWNKLCDDVKGIERGGYDEESKRKEQKINLNLNLSDEELMENEADILLIEILQNYGSDRNLFYSFKLFGRGISGSE